MSLLIVYHTLEPRDAAQISPVWKYLSVLLNLLSVFHGVACSYSFYCLMHAFDDYCILDARSRSNLRNELMEDSLENPKHPLEAHLNPFNGTHHVTTDDFHWGNFEKCEVGVYLPIVQAAFGVVWTGMFLIYGRGGASMSGLIPQPWCIVMPATIYTILMIIASSTYLGLVFNGLRHFCETLLALENFDMTCGELFDYYAKDLNVLQEVTTSMYFLLKPSQNLHALLCYMILAILNYFLFLVVIITRCLCVTDFVLVRVTIESFEGSVLDIKAIDRLLDFQELELLEEPDKVAKCILSELISETVNEVTRREREEFDAKRLVDNFYQNLSKEEKYLEAVLRARIDGSKEEHHDTEKIKGCKED